MQFPRTRKNPDSRPGILRSLLPVLSAAVLLAFPACREPQPDRTLIAVPGDKAGIRDTFRFLLPMNDTASRYRIHFSGRLNRGFRGNILYADLLLVSPEGEHFRETLRLPSAPEAIRNYLRECRRQGKDAHIRFQSAAGCRDIEWEWYRRLKPDPYGTWEGALVIRNPESGDRTPANGISCIGITCTTE